MSEWEEALPAAGGVAIWALRTQHRGSMPHPGKEAAFLPVEGSRSLQDSCGTSGLDHIRCAICIFGNCFIDWLLSK